MNVILKRALIIGIPSIAITALIIKSELEYKKELEQAKQYRDMIHENCDILMRVFKNMEETDQNINDTINTMKRIDRMLNLN